LDCIFDIISAKIKSLNFSGDIQSCSHFGTVNVV
jgi:hypothetical protein